MEHEELVQLVDPSCARPSAQMSLFPETIAALVREFGVSMVDVERMHDAGLLSFDPSRQTSALRAEEAAEAKFLLSLARGGCDLPLIRELVRDLDPPYAFDADAMVYDFSRRRWLALAGVSAGAAGQYAVSTASEEGDVHALAHYARTAIDALVSQAEEDEPE